MKLYFKFFSIHIKSQLQYRSSFLMSIFGQFLTSFGSMFAIYFMFQRFHTVDGFSMAESFLCYSVVLGGFSLAETFARGLDLFPGLIRRGELDRILVRPHGLIFQVLASEMDFTRLGKLLQAALVLLYAIPRSGIIWSADKIIVFILMIFSSFVVFSGTFLLYAAVSFFTIEGIEFMNIFTYGGKTFGEYPYSIYGSTVLKFLTYIIPLALFQYYPLLYISGRAPSWHNAVAPVIGCFFILPCILFWRFGLRNYKSTGS